MPPFVDCMMSMTQGNASDTPASASAPRRPTKSPSNVIMPASAMRLSTLGAASLTRVDSTGPSSNRLVLAAGGRAATVGIAVEVEIDIASLIMSSFAHRALEQHLRRSVFVNRAAALQARLSAASAALTVVNFRSVHFHAFCLDRGDGRGALQEYEESSDCLQFSCVHRNSGHDLRIVLQLIREWTQVIRAGLADDFADLRDAERALALGKGQFRDIATCSESGLRP